MSDLMFDGGGLFADLDMGGDLFMPPEPLADPSFVDPMLEAEVLDATAFMDFAELTPIVGTGALVSVVALPDPFQSGGGALEKVGVVTQVVELSTPALKSVANRFRRRTKRTASNHPDGDTPREGDPT
jgi:hypothetical protein